MKKYISLKENEELIIGNGTNKKSISIKNENDILRIREIDSCDKKDNIEITEISFDELKRFILFESYYQEISSSVDKITMRKINDILDYHYKNVYGEKYNSEYSNIKDTSFQAITTFEED
jgi:hypothetical protein